MDLVSLATMRGRAQFAANMETDSFVTTAEWNGYINYGLRRLYDVLVSAFGEDYFLKSYAVPLVSGTDTYALPSDFYRERAVDISVGGIVVSAPRFMFRDRNQYNWANISWTAAGMPPMYALVGTNIKFIPTPNVNGTGSVTLWYIPTIQKTTDGGATWTSGALSADGDQIDGINGYEELAVLEAAIRAKAKDDTDPSILLAQKAEVLAWITDAARNRNAGDPAFIGDVRNNYQSQLFGML